ncbi:efflux RND transporter permease subunit [Spirochaeta cellobiosiphila]|uniref:efflux RND transporter permease subunit n=1 Tax=Spirochaeta cellobiosiphila TaxID=504483 RepID=UPI00041370BB|nr:efflux RND transporter permease subunit [Spirochaeta cellobiosiphila]
MNLSEVSVNRPITIAVIATLLIGISLFMVPNLAVEMTPDVEFPMIIVSTGYPGASPEEVEQSITEILEKQLSNIGGLKDISSTSSEGSSTVVLEFGYNKNLDDATNDLRDSLDQIKNALPSDASSPTIFKFNTNSESIMNLIMVGDETADTLKRLAEDTVKPRLERIEGVSSADVSGGETRAVHVDLSTNRLEAYGITASQVISALSNRNLQISGGSLTTEGTDYDLRIDERYESIEDIARTVVSTISTTDNSSSVNRSSVVRLEDVADVYEGIENRNSIYYIDGRSAISIQISKESNTNSVKVAEEVLAQLQSINDELPNGVAVELLYDQTTYISSVMNQVYQSAWQGIILAMLVLFIFLRNMRSTIIIGVSIPISIMITLMAMYFFDITLNMMSLTGLILGLGMIVDNSIVILENIHQYRERGAKLRASAILGSHEMLNSIVASTLTTLSVFIPMIIWKDDLEIIGQFFSDMIFTVVISLTVSFFVAVTLVPAMSSKLIKLYTHKQRPIKNNTLRKMDAFGESILQGMENGYKKMLAFALRNRFLVLTLVLVVFTMSILKFSNMGISLIPQGGSDDSVRVSISLPVGTNMDYTEKITSNFVKIIEEEVTGYTHISMRVGGGRRFSGSSGNSASIQITLPELEEQTMSPSEIENVLRQHLNEFPDAEITLSSGRSWGGGSPINIAVYSQNTQLGEETATEIRDLIRENIPEAIDPVTDLDEGTPEYKITIDKDRAAAYGFTVSEIGNVINNMVDGRTPTSYWDEATELDIIVQLAEDERSDLLDLDSISIMSSSGEKVPLYNLVSYELSTGPLTVNREDEKRVVHVTADLAEGAASNQVQPMIASLLKEKLILPDGVTYDFGGDRSSFATMIPALITVSIVAVMMIFGIMASQFESLVDPFIIFFSIPLLFIGVVLVYTITGATISLFSMIGMVVLAGIVVNNGIVMVDYMNLLRKRGAPVKEAVLEGARSRLRPILMTSLTTILGMVPMGFFPGSGTEMIQPIGQTIVGGLTGSTFITLFVTPIIYTLVNRDKKNKKKYLETENLVFEGE